MNTSCGINRSTHSYLLPACSGYGNIDASTVVSTKTCFDPNGERIALRMYADAVA
jgi:hypothetical protein